jgi:glycogen(starch) synthase
VKTPSSKDVAIVTPWYPTADRPFRGAFVQAMVEATAPVADRIVVYHCDEWGYRPARWSVSAVDRAHRDLVHHATTPAATVAGAELRYVPVPLPTGLGFGEIARRGADSLRSALGGRPIDATVVHAHVGLPGGWTALENAPPDARVFVTEHATFLDRVLAQPQARAMYDEVLHRCDGFLAVGAAVSSPLIEAFPHHRDRITIVANPVSFALERPFPVTRLNRWLYVGTLIPRKGVMLLLEAFAACRADEPGLTLTIVGEGELLPQLIAKAAALDVADAVTFAGAVAPTEALRLMREHDLLVHASRFETFGMTVVEAIAAGLPVLVTRCGGPEETLAGVDQYAAELVDVEDTPASMIAGFRRLRGRFPHALDMARARDELARRYGYEAVAQTHRRLWFPAADEPEVPQRSGVGHHA